MSYIGIISLLHDLNVNKMKSHTFKEKHSDNIEKVTFNVEKSDGTRIEVSLNTVLSFQTMSSRMSLTCPTINLSFNKFLLHKALEERWSVTPHEEVQTVENFKYLLSGSPLYYQTMFSSSKRNG